jgi:hypothetical protein
MVSTRQHARHSVSEAPLRSASSIATIDERPQAEQVGTTTLADPG